MKTITMNIDSKETDQNEEYDLIDQQSLNDLRIELRSKSHSDLVEECCNEQCTGAVDLFSAYQFGWNESVIFKNVRCGPLRRIRLILDLYDQCTESERRSISTILQREDYGHQQLLDDFLHIQQVHCQQKQRRKQSVFCQDDQTSLNPTEIICHFFQSEFPCDNDRHISRRDNDRARHRSKGKSKRRRRSDIINEKDDIFQHELDKIHYFFIHSPSDNTNDQKENEHGDAKHDDKEEESKGDEDSFISKNMNTPSIDNFTKRRSTTIGMIARLDSMSRNSILSPNGKTPRSTNNGMLQDFEQIRKEIYEIDINDIDLGVRSPSNRSVRGYSSVQTPMDTIDENESVYETESEMEPELDDNFLLQKNSTARARAVSDSSSLMNKKGTDYVGEQEDVEWITRLESKQQYIHHESTLQMSDTIKDDVYQRLIKAMGMFIWQSAQYV